MTREEAKTELGQLEEWWARYQAMAAQAPRKERRAAVLQRIIREADRKAGR